MLRRAAAAATAVAASISLVHADSVVRDNSSTWWQTVDPVQTFHSSNLTPPVFNILTYDTSKPIDGNYTLLSYRGTGTSQPAPLIMDNNGAFSTAVRAIVLPVSSP